jgi:hypothetical protein
VYSTFTARRKFKASPSARRVSAASAICRNADFCTKHCAWLSVIILIKTVFSFFITNFLFLNLFYCVLFQSLFPAIVRHINKWTELNYLTVERKDNCHNVTRHVTYDKIRLCVCVWFEHCENHLHSIVSQLAFHLSADCMATDVFMAIWLSVTPLHLYQGWGYITFRSASCEQLHVGSVITQCTSHAVAQSFVRTLGAPAFLSEPPGITCNRRLLR